MQGDFIRMPDKIVSLLKVTCRCAATPFLPQFIKKGIILSHFGKTTFRAVSIAILAIVPVISHAYPADPEECKAAEGVWIDFKTTPSDGWCRGPKATPTGPIMVCAKVKGIEQKVGSEMVCIPRDVARQKLLLEHDVPAKAI